MGQKLGPLSQIENSDNIRGKHAATLQAAELRTMSAANARNLLDEALERNPVGSNDAARRRFILVEDSVETSGGFVLHQLTKKALLSSERNEGVIFLALAQNFSHYDRVLRKLVSVLPFFLSCGAFFLFFSPSKIVPGEKVISYYVSS